MIGLSLGQEQGEILFVETSKRILQPWRGFFSPLDVSTEQEEKIFPSGIQMAK